jgi:WD40 repeat protein
LIEVDSYIFAVGEGSKNYKIIFLGFIDVFYIDFTKGIINNITSISNEFDKTEVDCISFSSVKNLFMCGHKSGSISAWMPDQQTILKNVGTSKFHDGAINKIFFKNTLISGAMQQFVITCSSDSTLKVFKSDSFENVATKNFDSGVLDIFQSNDYENTEQFLVNLENGDLVGLNLGFEIIFKIPSQFGFRVSNIFNNF